MEGFTVPSSTCACLTGRHRAVCLEPLTQFYAPHSAFRIPHSAFRIPHSAFRIPHSAFCITCPAAGVPLAEHPPDLGQGMTALAAPW
jgi:hypothetical protein